VSGERYTPFQFMRDVLFETDKKLKKHITPSPPVKVEKIKTVQVIPEPESVKRVAGEPLWESEWKEGEEILLGHGKSLDNLA